MGAASRWNLSNLDAAPYAYIERFNTTASSKRVLKQDRKGVKPCRTTPTRDVDCNHEGSSMAARVIDGASKSDARAEAHSRAQYPPAVSLRLCQCPAFERLTVIQKNLYIG